MTPKDWTLLVLAAAKGRSVQPVHLQKALFVLSRQFRLEQLQVERFYNFEAYDYGPFCSAVYTDAEELASEGLVEIKELPYRSYRQYAATEDGLASAATLQEDLDPEVTEYLDRLVMWMSRRSFREVVSAIYKAFPDMKVNSIFQE